MNQKFYFCKHCGNIVAFVKESGVRIKCCGENMVELVSGLISASVEKHQPIIIEDGNKVIVLVGDVPHSMTQEHYIEWISLQTKEGNQRKVLLPNDPPSVEFYISKTDTVEAVYAYCNLHGLWKSE